MTDCHVPSLYLEKKMISNIITDTVLQHLKPKKITERVFLQAPGESMNDLADFSSG